MIAQQRFPLFTWEMRLQPENPMNAVHSKLKQSGAIHGLSDQIQRETSEVNLLCRSKPKEIVRAATKTTTRVNDSTACPIESADIEAKPPPPKDVGTRPGLLQVWPAPTASPVLEKGGQQVRSAAIWTPRANVDEPAATAQADEAPDRDL